MDWHLLAYGFIGHIAGILILPVSYQLSVDHQSLWVWNASIAVQALFVAAGFVFMLFGLVRRRQLTPGLVRGLFVGGIALTAIFSQAVWWLTGLHSDGIALCGGLSTASYPDLTRCDFVQGFGMLRGIYSLSLLSSVVVLLYSLVASRTVGGVVPGSIYSQVTKR